MARRRNSETSRTHDAVTWYLRHKYLQVLGDKVYTQKQIADEMGIPDTRLIYLRYEAKGAGWALLDAFSRFYRTTPDQLVREALTWWANGGDEQSQIEMARMDREKQAAHAEKVMSGKKERRTSSSERPSVKLLASKPSNNEDEKKHRRGA